MPQRFTRFIESLTREGQGATRAGKYWGAQTERSRKNFKIDPAASMPR